MLAVCAQLTVGNVGIVDIPELILEEGWIDAAVLPQVRIAVVYDPEHKLFLSLRLIMNPTII